MPNLYGSGGQSQSLYGNVLSERNQRQAEQLNLPGAIQQPGEAGQAGSQQAAQSDWANFEDVFNKNRGYAAKTLTGAVGKVNETAGVKPTTEKLEKPAPPAPPAIQAPTQQNTPQALAAPSANNAVNPAAPAALQGASLNAIQGKADLLGGYGQTAPALQVVGAQSGAQQLGGGGEQPQSQQYAARAVPRAPEAQAAPAPNSVDDILPPAPAPVAEASAPPPLATTTDPNAPQDPVEFAKKQLAGLGPDEPSKDELAQYDKLRKTNDLLKGYASDGGVDILQQVYGSGAGQWDADIMNTGGGREAFGELQKKYGGKDAEFAKQIGQRVNETADYRKSLLDQIKGYQDQLNAPQAAPVDNSIRISAMPQGSGGQVLGVTPETQAQWESLPPETISSQMMGNKSYVEASGEKSSLPGLLTGTFGVSAEDANVVTSYLTPEDWAAYQAALQQAIKEKNPKAILAWISDMLSKNKGL